MSKGLSSVKTLTAKEIANKWNLPLSVVAKKIAAGVKVEKEHTKSTRQANEIARDHLGERPDYYDKLHKMEKQPVVKENTSVTGVAGLGYNTGVPAIDDDNEYITTNALARDPMNGAIMDFINKHHQHLHGKTSFKQYDAKKIKTNSNKDLAESLGSDYGTAAVPIVGDLTGTPRKVSKVDEVKLPAKARKAVATGMTLANLYTAGDVASRAQQGIGSPVKDIVTAASTLPGTKGWSAYGADKARQAYEYIKGKRMKENKNLVPANTVERGIYEATFQGKTVPLGKPMKGDVKKSKVYVDPDGDGKAQKVNFGDPNMTIKKSNPARRKSFRARHNCDNPGPKTKARYWSCRAWEETELFETTLKKKIKYAIKAAGQQSRIAKELRPDEVESDKTFQKRKKGLDRVFKESKDVPYNHGRGKAGVGETPVASRADGSGTYYKLARGHGGKSTHHVIYTKKGETVQSKTEKSALKKLDKLDEISAELVGKVSNARFWRGEAPSKTLSRAINKKYIESGKKKDTKTNTKEETTMDTKDLINEALDNILEENLVAMRENLQTALQEKMMEKLEERKKIIASDYFAQ